MVKIINTKIIFFIIFSLLICYNGINATHFRYMTAQYEPVAGTDTNFMFTISMAWRISFFYGSTGEQNFKAQACNANDLKASTGQLTSSSARVTFPDGNKNPTFICHCDDIWPRDTQDYFQGVWTYPYTFPNNVGTDYNVQLNSCCRLKNTLVDGNTEAGYRVLVTITVGRQQRNPVITSAAIVACPFAEDGYNFLLAGTDWQGRSNLKYIMSTTSESRLRVIHPAFSVSQDGVVTYHAKHPNSNNPNNHYELGFYAIQVRVETSDDSTLFNILDFLIDLTDKAFPYFDYQVNGGLTPDRGSRVSSPLGQGLEITLVAKMDTQGVGVTIKGVQTRDGLFLDTYCQEVGQTQVEMSYTGTCTKVAYFTPQLGDLSGISSQFQAITSEYANRLTNFYIDIIKVDLIYLSGIVRDFAPGAYHDRNFERPNNENNFDFTLPNLDSNGKPQFDVSAIPSLDTGSDLSNDFYYWFNTDPSYNREFVRSITLGELAAKPEIFQLQTGTFYLIEGVGYFADDQWTSGEHNGYYTYELHTTVTYFAGALNELSFASSDDLWIWVNGTKVISMPGTHDRSQVQTLDFATMGFADEESVSLDLFWAHRSSEHESQITWDMLGSATCDALARGIEEFAYHSDFDSDVQLNGATLNSGNLQLLASGDFAASSSAWYKNPVVLLNGFRADFSVMVDSTTTEGFAFVIHADDRELDAKGFGGESMGYGGLENSVAIEFDLTWNSQTDGGLSGTYSTGDDHITLHTNYGSPNDAIENIFASGVTKAIAPSVWEFQPGVLYNFTVELSSNYLGNGGDQSTFYRLFNNTGDVSAPVLEAILDGAYLKTMFGAGAFVGFTASNRANAGATVTITDFTLETVPIEASNTAAQQSAYTLSAGSLASVRVAVRDACNNKLAVGGDKDKFNITLVHQMTGETIVTNIRDDNNGNYTIEFTGSTTGTYDLHIHFLPDGAIQDTPISNSPVLVTISPGDMSPTVSWIDVPFDRAAVDVNTTNTFYVYTKDSQNNTLFDPDVGLIKITPSGVGSNSLVIAKTSVEVNRTSVERISVSFGTTQSGIYQILVAVTATEIQVSGGVETGVIEVAVRPQKPVAANSYFRGLLVSVEAGEEGFVTIVPVDVFGNQVWVISPQADSITGNIVIDSTPTNAFTRFEVVADQDGVAAIIKAYFNVTKTSPSGGSHEAFISIDGVQVSGSVEVVVSAAAVHPPLTLISHTGALVAGEQATFQVVTQDRYGNVRPGFSPGLVATTVPDIGSPTVTFSGLGVYNFYLTPQDATVDLQVTVTYSATPLGNSPFVKNVVPGEVSSQSEMSGTFTQATAGVPFQFQIISKDSQGNLRDLAEDDSAKFEVSVKLGSTSIDVSPTITKNSGEQWKYDVTGTFIIAQEHTVSVIVAQTTAPIQNVPQVLAVVPGPIDDSKTQYFGPGKSGGIVNKTVAFQIYTFDQYNNELVGAGLHTFQIRLRDWEGNQLMDQGSPLLYTAAYLDEGRYNASYVVPPINTVENATYFIDVERDASRVDTLAALAISSDVVAAATMSLDATYVAGVNNVNLSIVLQGTGPDVYVISITPKPAQEGLSGADAQDRATVVEAGHEEIFSFPKAGEYVVKYYFKGVVEPDDSVAGLEFTVIPDAFHPPSSEVIGVIPSERIAGQTVSFSLQLKDQWGNKILTALNPAEFEVRLIGSTIFPINATYNSLTIVHTGLGVYDIDFIIKKMAFRTITLQGYNVVGDSVQVITTKVIEVKNTVPDATKSDVVVLSSTVVAGDSVGVKVTLRDQYHNLVRYNAEAITIDFGLFDSGETEDTSVVFPQDAPVNGITTTGFQIFTAGVWSVKAELSAVEIGKPAFTVVAGDVAAINWQSSPASTPTAGDDIDFSVVSTDAYGNDWIPQTGIHIKYQILGPDAYYIEGNLDQVSSTNEFEANLASHPRKAGTYTIRVSAKGQQYLEQNFDIVHGLPSADQSEDITGLELFAGQVGKVSLKLSDAYGNPIRAEDVTGFLASDGVTLRFFSSQTPCDDDDGEFRIDSPESFTSSCRDVAADNIGVECSISVNIRGVYYYKVFINGAEKPGCQLESLVTVRPGAPDPSQCTLSVDTYGGEVGQQIYFTVTAVDSFGNDVGYGGSLIHIGKVCDDGCNLTETCNGYALNYVHDKCNVELDPLGVLDTQDGYYTARFAPTKKSSTGFLFDVFIYPDNVVLTEANQNSYKIPNTRRGIFVESFISAFEILSDSDIVTAAIPDGFLLRGTDRYGNPVTTSDHTYDVRFGATEFDFIFNAEVINLGTGTHKVRFLPAFHGKFDVWVVLKSDELDANPLSADLNATRVIAYKQDIVHATCEYENPGKPVRCHPDRSCEAEYGDCTDDGRYQALKSGCGFLCAPHPSHTDGLEGVVGYCVDKPEDCDCPIGEVRCSSLASSGGPQCSVQGLCPPAESPVTTQTSTAICTPGFYLCPDGVSCGKPGQLGSCFDTSRVSTIYDCGAREFRCFNGICASKLEDCPTVKTCKDVDYICPDGSCVSDATQCMDQYDCYKPNRVRCQDGSCRKHERDCPSRVTCPPNHILCEFGGCYPTLEECPTAIKCDKDTTRCPDGSCTENLLFCPSRTTCPLSSPVLCSDGSCVKGVDSCKYPAVLRQCPVDYTSCSDGTCVACNGNCDAAIAYCPTAVSCPRETPVKCSNNECRKTLDECSAKQIVCTGSRPYRCSGGSCAASSTQCPTQVICPALAPIRCREGDCVRDTSECLASQTLECSEGFISCPEGECVKSGELCPTHVTCPDATLRCADGTCRSSCNNVATIKCPVVDELKCPVSTQGAMCVDKLENCPQQVVCSSEQYPIKCADGSCKSTANECPFIDENIEAELGFKVPCPDGSWAFSGQCGSVVTCPESAPAKCVDETCRVTLADCPTNEASSLCDKYWCANSALCAESPGECPVSSSCPSVKCVDGSCADRIDDCPLPFPPVDGFVPSETEDISNSDDSLDALRIKVDFVRATTTNTQFEDALIAELATETSIPSHRIKVVTEDDGTVYIDILADPERQLLSSLSADLTTLANTLKDAKNNPDNYQVLKSITPTSAITQTFVQNYRKCSTNEGIQYLRECPIPSQALELTLVTSNVTGVLDEISETLNIPRESIVVVSHESDKLVVSLLAIGGEDVLEANFELLTSNIDLLVGVTPEDSSLYSTLEASKITATKEVSGFDYSLCGDTYLPACVVGADEVKFTLNATTYAALSDVGKDLAVDAIAADIATALDIDVDRVKLLEFNEVTGEVTIAILDDAKNPGSVVDEVQELSTLFDELSKGIGSGLSDLYNGTNGIVSETSNNEFKSCSGGKLHVSCSLYGASVVVTITGGTTDSAEINNFKDQVRDEVVKATGVKAEDVVISDYDLSTGEVTIIIVDDQDNPSSHLSSIDKLVASASFGTSQSWSADSFNQDRTEYEYQECQSGPKTSCDAVSTVVTIVLDQAAGPSSPYVVGIADTLDIDESRVEASTDGNTVTLTISEDPESTDPKGEIASLLEKLPTSGNIGPAAIESKVSLTYLSCVENCDNVREAVTFGVSVNISSLPVPGIGEEEFTSRFLGQLSLATGVARDNLRVVDIDFDTGFVTFGIVQNTAGTIDFADAFNNFVSAFEDLKSETGLLQGRDIITDRGIVTEGLPVVSYKVCGDGVRIECELQADQVSFVVQGTPSDTLLETIAASLKIGEDRLDITHIGVDGRVHLAIKRAVENPGAYTSDIATLEGIVGQLPSGPLSSTAIVAGSFLNDDLVLTYNDCVGVEQLVCGVENPFVPDTAKSSGGTGTGGVYTGPLDCPDGGFKCSSGLCMKRREDCPEPRDFMCPTDFILCQAGNCVAAPDFPAKCLNQSTGCLQNQFQCETGLCVDDQLDCEGETFTCPQGEIKCPDGTCAVGQCIRGANGCFEYQEVCFDGTCVNKGQDSDEVRDLDSECIDKTKGGVNACPSDSPYKCSNGFCAISSIYCPVDTFTCGGATPVSCAVGTCVSHSSKCPVIKPCTDFKPFRCNNGFCKATQEECPASNSCPASSPFRCSSGLCALNEDSCTGGNGCPLGTKKCASNGACIPEAESCTKFDQNPNGCPIGLGHKCENGDCVADASFCVLRNGCEQTKPFRCFTNAVCYADVADCPSNGQKPRYECADGSFADKMANCKTASGCPISEPIRCADGSCAAGRAGSTTAGKTCKAVVTCTDDKPFRCSDGSCVGNSNYCPSFVPCPIGQQKCRDGTCKDSCPAEETVCPSTSPYLCDSGSCSDSIGGCPQYSLKQCGNSEVQCFDGFCGKASIECITRKAQLLLENRGFTGVFSQNMGVDDICSKDDQLCPKVDGVNKCAKKLTICPDGTCAEAKDCVIVGRCDSVKRVRCGDGSCAAQVSDCPANVPCFGKETRCPDGSCRAECLPWNGCGLKAPFLCDNGLCAFESADCVSPIALSFSEKLFSVFDSNFQVLTAEQPNCVENCYRQVSASRIHYSIDPRVSSVIAVAIDDNSNVRSSLTITSATLNGVTPIIIRPVADSSLQDIVNNVHRTRRPEFGARKTLSFIETVVSAPFECEVRSSEPVVFTQNITIVSHVDNLYNTSNSDLCLAFINELGEWECVFTDRVDRLAEPVWSETWDWPKYRVTSYFSSCTDENDQPRIFAFIRNPLPDKVTVPTLEKNWLERNWVEFMIIITSVSVCLMGILYVILRLARYAPKRDEEAQYVEEMEEIVAAREDGVKRVEEDIIFTNNPLSVQIADLQKNIDEADFKIERQQRANRHDRNEEQMDDMRLKIKQLRDEQAKLRAEVKYEKQKKLNQKAKVDHGMGQQSIELAGSKKTEKVSFQQFKPKKKRNI